jgi:hypothetical protein
MSVHGLANPCGKHPTPFRTTIPRRHQAVKIAPPPTTAPSSRPPATGPRPSPAAPLLDHRLAAVLVFESVELPVPYVLEEDPDLAPIPRLRAKSSEAAAEPAPNGLSPGIPLSPKESPVQRCPDRESGRPSGGFRTKAGSHRQDGETRGATKAGAAMLGVRSSNDNDGVARATRAQRVRRARVVSRPDLA